MHFLDGVVKFFHQYPQLALVAVIFFVWILKEVFQAYFKAALLVSLLIGGLVSVMYSMQGGHSLEFLGMKMNNVDTPQTKPARLI